MKRRERVDEKKVDNATHNAVRDVNRPMDDGIGPVKLLLKM
jgi:hypothetical protein